MKPTGNVTSHDHETHGTAALLWSREAGNGPGSPRCLRRYYILSFVLQANEQHVVFEMDVLEHIGL